AGGGGSPALFARGLEHGDWAVRVAALASLPTAVAREDALRLAGAAVADTRVEVRLAAARVLARLGLSERARAEFTAALSDRSPAVRLSAATDLVRLADERGVSVLDELARDPDAETRLAAVRAHRLTGRITEGLVLAFADPTAGVRL